MSRVSSRQSVRGIARLDGAFLAVLPATNKPKALSAETTAELGTKAGSDGRAVLLNKTLPCPNKA